MPSFRTLTEALARRTSRRGAIGAGVGAVFGTLAGVAAGTGTREAAAGALKTTCVFPGQPCLCERCRSNGVCAKPCAILTTFYATGCWVSFEGATCCDCDCLGRDGIGWCGCGTDYHNSLVHCPNGTAEDH